MVELIEPNGETAIIVRLNYAIEYCRTHAGWTWQYLMTDRLTSNESDHNIKLAA